MPGRPPYENELVKGFRFSDVPFFWSQHYGAASA
jgi:hypothetical protein